MSGDKGHHGMQTMSPWDEAGKRMLQRVQGGRMWGHLYSPPGQRELAQ